MKKWHIKKDSQLFNWEIPNEEWILIWYNCNEPYFLLLLNKYHNNMSQILRIKLFFYLIIAYVF